MDMIKKKKIFGNLPTIETQRLILKKITMDNLYDMNRYATLEKTSEYLAWTPHLNLLETRGTIQFHQEQYKMGLAPDWGVNLKSNNMFVGTCGFTSVDEYNHSAEIGYVLSPEYWGQGLMKEAVKAVMRVAFMEIGFHRLIARIMDGNERSARLATSLGFVHEGTGRECQLIKGKYTTVHTYSILIHEYERMISV